MRRPLSRIARNRVAFTPINFGKDEDGGRPTRAATPSAPLKCRFHPSTAEDVPEHLRETGVLYMTIHLFQDPGDLRVRDLAVWLDYTPPRTCLVAGPPRPASGEMRTWEVDVTYRPPANPTPRT
jgi:hypothetical protein